MTTDAQSQPPQGPVVPRPHRLIRNLALLYGGAFVAAAVLLCAGALPPQLLPGAGALAREAVTGGLAALVLEALLLALTALLGTLAVTAARYRHAAAQPPGAAARRGVWADPGFAARQGQAFIMPLGAGCIWAAARWLWPAAGTGPAAGADIAAALVFGLAFASLVCERVMNAFPEPQLPEAPALRRILLLTTLLLAAAACIGLGRGAGLGWIRWPELVLACIPAVVAAELAVRALARLFLPPRAAPDARAAADSIVAGLLTGGPRAPAILLRDHLGLDFARSWALSFLSAAVLPALFGTALFCWGLSGLKLIDLEHRGVYERFGAPVAVLGPGLHLLLPWPFGRLRLVEYGTIHSIPIGVDPSAAQAAQSPVGAEATPPAALNRLWESAHADQAHYLVPSPGTAQQSLQSVSTEIHVLYRVGLTEDAALHSLYTVADPQSLIEEAASRLVLRYFNSRTLDDVIGARRENVAAMLRQELAADPAVSGSGIDIVSVLIEEIHPPEGAAAAYHAVQAAEINANASIANELGRAKRTAGVAAEEAHQLDAAADARAVEIAATAGADAYGFGADRRAYQQGRQSFLLERRFGRLVAALSRAQVTLIDHRLSPQQSPILDMRAAASAPAAAGGSAGAGASGGTSGGAGAGSAPPLTPEIVPEEQTP